MQKNLNPILLRPQPEALIHRHTILAKGHPDKLEPELDPSLPRTKMMITTLSSSSLACGIRAGTPIQIQHLLPFLFQRRLWIHQTPLTVTLHKIQIWQLVNATLHRVTFHCLQQPLNLNPTGTFQLPLILLLLRLLLLLQPSIRFLQM